MSTFKVIFGAGLYGLYAALFCAKQGDRVLVLEHDSAPFKRATYINQARVHMGYHYPRSISTAIKSRGYFDRFNEDYGFCVHDSFKKVYATSASFSWTNADQFRKFCADADIRCDDVSPTKYFREGMCDGTFVTTEYTYDANILRDHLLEEIKRYPKIELRYGVRTQAITKQDTHFSIQLATGETIETTFILNATYASINQIHALLHFDPFGIKYELCEIILCKVNGKLNNVGVTVMDGPFFSIMPFGKTGYHSLTSVTFTPHITSFDHVPTFVCQKRSNGHCSPKQLGNCNDCPAKPESAWPYMSSLARKYMNDSYQFEYVESLFSMKPILKASEIDDSRPTVIRKYTSDPTFVSVLSGKINTVYDLDDVLRNR